MFVVWIYRAGNMNYLLILIVLHNTIIIKRFIWNMLILNLLNQLYTGCEQRMCEQQWWCAFGFTCHNQWRIQKSFLFFFWLRGGVKNLLLTYSIWKCFNILLMNILLLFKNFFGKKLNNSINLYIYLWVKYWQAIIIAAHFFKT